MSQFQTSKRNILVVDDTQQNLELIAQILKKRNLAVQCTTNSATGLKMAQSGWADLILLDIKMPGMNGYEVCQQLKATESTQDIPIIFLSASEETFDIVTAFTVGGADYICKPFEIEEFLVRIQNQLNLLEARAKIVQLNTELEQRVQQRTLELEQTNQQLKQEIAERQKIQQKLLHLALHDKLTGLANRLFFLQRLHKIIKHTQEHPEHLFAVLFLDGDRFKLINDSLGHIVGDKVLISLAYLLKSCLNSQQTLARFGGDEFAILLPQVSSIDRVIDLAQKIQEKLNVPFEINQQQLFFTVSIGIVLGTKEYKSPEYILRDADTAMYHAKAKGKSRYQLFDLTMHKSALTRFNLETDLRLALKRQELIVYYQPIIDLETNSILAFEALVRWQHPQKGLISPGEFIPVAEDTGLIVPLGLWVMRQACRQLYLWQQSYALTGVKMGVNLSVKQFSQPDLIAQIDRILHDTQLDSCSLKLEITESAIMDNAESVTILFQQLKDRNIQLSIDDFGTGYSSLSYLHRFHVDTLKIDRSFVSHIGDAGENTKIIETIVTLAHHLNMTVVAEGIETKSQKNYLQSVGCEAGQGYFFAQPLSAKGVELILQEKIQIPLDLELN
ncbi:MAG: EAL domain-containing protein [Pleurocapsa sp.]